MLFSVRRLINNFISKCRFDVTIGDNSFVHRCCQFDGANAIGNDTKIFGSVLGYGSYVANHSLIKNAKIGAFSCIGDGVRTGLGRHPINDFVSIHPAFYSTEAIIGFTFADRQKFDEHLFVDEQNRFFVSIGSDVWIGNNVIILDGVTIGNGAVVAAGAVVTKSIDPFSVVGGVPARVLKMRFADDDIDRIMASKWWDRDIDWIRKNADSFISIERFKEIDDSK